MICPKCGKEVGNAKFCPECGSPLVQDPHMAVTSPPDNRYIQTQTSYKTNANNIPSNKKQSTLGIIGLVLSCTGCLSFIGLVISLVDLSKKDKTRKHTCAIIGAIIGGILTMLLWFFYAISSSTTDADATKTTTTQSSEQLDDSADATENSETEKKDYFEVGESFDNGSLKITINNTSTDFTDYADEYGFNTPNDGMKYVMADFTYENIGENGDEYASISDFDCFADNSTCEQEFGLDDNDFYNTNLSPGRNVSFRVYFQVPVNASSIELEYKENFWTDDRVKIKIQ